MAKQQEEIRILAEKYEKLQTLMCYVNKDTLLAQLHKQKNGKASGVDGISKDKYEQNVNENIDELFVRMKKFAYKPQQVKRVYIPKLGSDKLRPLGIPAYKDRLVQGAMADVLNEIYETKFLNCSYGFRPKRNCHQAIAKVNRAIQFKRINYVLDVDIKGFFDNVDHKWMVKFLEHTIQDKNFIRYIVRFLKSGVMEEAKSYKTERGTPQGGLKSPILSNVYLHYVLDLWFENLCEHL
ncbi:MAG: reverse transcriptase domain-containing protein [Erysipelotrichaceae bacterium]